PPPPPPKKAQTVSCIVEVTHFDFARSAGITHCFILVGVFQYSLWSSLLSRSLPRPLSKSPAGAERLKTDLEHAAD
ncbi:hypothetical protein VN97_g5206, partial [Penicillium thymicola]